MDGNLSILAHPLVAPALAGVLAHAVTNRRPPTSLAGFFLVLCLLPFLLTSFFASLSALSIIFTFFRTLAIYWAALATSVTAYRLSPLHPLARYPGPVGARISRLWWARVSLTGAQHLCAYELHARYGPVVRSGPDHLLIKEADAVSTVLGAKAGWHKGPRYEVTRPKVGLGSLLLMCDPAEHGRRRRIWNRAFTAGAIKSYEPHLTRHVANLVVKLDTAVTSGETLDMAATFTKVTFEYMNDFAFGGALAGTAESVEINKIAHEGAAMIEVVGTLPWLRPLMQVMPQVKLRRLRDMSLAQVQRRRVAGSKVRDLMYYLLDEDNEGAHPPLPEVTLGMEAGFVMVAGSDTTSGALSNALFYLLTVPGPLKALRAELDAAADGAAFDIDMDSAVLASLPYLNAVIDETNRLQPAVPTGTQRVPPADGGPQLVAGHIVPVGTTVQIPTWSLHRDARYFAPEPEAFWPERWMPEGKKLAEARGLEFRHEQTAYIPFSHGPANCIARLLALQALRVVLAAIVRRFDFALAPGFMPREWTDRLEDRFILEKGSLPVVISRRVA